MKHAYIPRTTTYNLNPGEELNDLRMSDEVRPLYEHVKKFIRETVDPMSVEFMRLGEGKKDRWSFTPEQLAVLQKAKDKAKEEGLWNFFLPDAETGEGLIECITDSYRSYDAQVDVYDRKPGLAAVPGTSEHGWGLALDVGCGANSFGGALYEWLDDNADDYGWDNPDWARPSGSTPEPWHWEFDPESLT